MDQELPRIHAQPKVVGKTKKIKDGDLRRRQTEAGFRQAKRGRLVNKSGVLKLTGRNISDRHQRYMADIFTTLVDLSWKWNLLIFAAGFLLSWLIFGIIWYTIPLMHGDLDHINETDWATCLKNVETITAALLFSIESQHTIGYGYMHVTDNCFQAIATVAVQSVVGITLKAFLVGIIFAKLSKPTKRAKTLFFSKNAVICLRDGFLCFMFRIGDVRKSHFIDPNFRAILVKQRVTKEGEVMPFYQDELILSADDQVNVMLLWPLTVTHVIDKTSPLYGFSAEQFKKQKFEIIILLGGCIESTSRTTEARTSYLPEEIRWGHRFENLIMIDHINGNSWSDYRKFHETYEVQTPMCSARDLELKNLPQRSLSI